jgi:hypothetical protein
MQRIRPATRASSARPIPGRRPDCKRRLHLEVPGRSSQPAGRTVNAVYTWNLGTSRLRAARLSFLARTSIRSTGHRRGR